MFRLRIGDAELLVVSAPGAHVEADALSDAERAVVRDAARGLSNLAIARRRRRSSRTIANQLSSAFKKLGVSSRAELAARLARHHAE